MGRVPIGIGFHCKGCRLGKQIQLPYSSSTTHSSHPFDLVHSDVWGPSPFVSKGGHKHYVIFVDDHSRHTWVYFMKHRSELFPIYKAFVHMVHTQFSSAVRVFRSDSGGSIYLLLFASFSHLRVLSLSFHALVPMLRMALLSVSIAILLRQLVPF